MSLGSFSCLPPEIIAQICNYLPFDNVIALQDTHVSLELLINTGFFTKFRQAELVWEEDGSLLTLNGPSVNKRTISTSDSRIWRDLIRQTCRVNSLELCKFDSARNTEVITELSENWKLQEMTILMRRGSKAISDKAALHGFKKLTRLVSAHKKTLKVLRLESDPLNSVELNLKKVPAVLHYDHYPNLLIHTQLIYPLFHAMTADGPGCAQLSLRIEGSDQLELSLQNAFQTALPFQHRDSLRVLRMEFGNKVSKLTQEEMHRVVSVYAPYLNTTRQLQHVVCDLSHTTLNPSCLEAMYMAISRELRSSHRISLRTRVPEPAVSCHRNGMLKAAHVR